MSLSKKMKKILAGFYDAVNLYEEAFDLGDSANALKFGGEFVAYVEKFQKELTISDEYLKGMKETLASLEKSTEKAARIEAELEKVRRERKDAEQKYYEFLLKEPSSGKKRTKH